jgi:UDP-N-acetylglucosamine acyltransferase
MSTTIDPRAAVSPRAILGDGVTVGPFTVVEDGAVVGDRTIIAANAFIARGARIGRECQIHHGAVIGHAPQDLKYRDEPTTCEVGDRTVIREYAVYHRGTGEHGRTTIGSDCFLMAYTHIAHDCAIGNRVILANSVQIAGHVEIEDWVIVGGLTPIHQFVHIGQHAMVGGGIRVPKDVPPYTLASGDPARFEGLNHVGLRRRGFSRESLDCLDRAYVVLYHSGLNVTQAVARMKEDASLVASPEVQNLLTFIARSSRGIMPGPRLIG